MDHDRDQPQLTNSFSTTAPSDGSHIFSSAASSLPSSTHSSQSDGKLLTRPEKCLAVTLLYSYKNDNNVLFLEAGKDFVDILLDFLTLPMGRIIRLLYGSGGGGGGLTGLVGLDEGIFKLFDSVEKMDDARFCTSKKSLLDPQQEPPGLASKQQEHATRPSSSGDCGGPSYYCCGMVPQCVCITKKKGRRCPRHGRKMQTLCKFVEGKWERESGSGSRDNGGKAVETIGYVKDICRYFITDNLEVHPCSKSLAILHKLKVERMSMLKSLDLFVGMEEILKLLKASLVSNNVLQDVFGRIVEERSFQVNEKMQHRPRKCNSDVNKPDQAMKVYPTLQGCHNTIQDVINSLQRVDNYEWSHCQSKPCSNLDLQKPQSFSIPPKLKQSNSKSAKSFLSKTQKNLVTTSLSECKLRQNSSCEQIYQ